MSTSNATLLICERRAVTSDHIRVVATGEVDLATGPALVDVLRAAQADARHVVLDLAGTTFMDVGGVRILLAAAERAHIAAETTFEIVHATAPVTRVLSLTGADRALERPTVNFPQAKGAGDGVRAATPLPTRKSAVPRSLPISAAGP